jgi:HAD superfamily hydrolase (TIGR01549 family)
MSRADFSAVVLDLFDTLVRWEPDRLPLMELRGKQVHTTMPWVFPKMAELFGCAFDQDLFVETYSAVVEEIMAEREREQIEITCHERFHRTLTRLDIGVAAQHAIFAEELTRVHMAAVRGVTSAPAARIEAVRRIAPYYRLGLLSNFDDARCGREVLEDTGLAHLFEVVVISAEVRLRKPDRRIFDHMCELLRVAPHEVLFVGDTPRDDMLGAREAGMRTAWISKGAPAIPEGIPAPDFIIPDLSDLPRVLEI